MYQLPKKHNRQEAKVDGLVAKKLIKKHPHRNWLLEVKIEGKKQEQNQKKVQKQVENGTFLWKPPDMGNRQPGDYIHLGDADYILCTVDGRNVTCEVNGGAFEHRFRI